MVRDPTMIINHPSFLSLLNDLLKDGKTRVYDAFKNIDTILRLTATNFSEIEERLKTVERAMPHCTLYSTINQTLTSGVITSTIYNTVLEDNDGMANLAVNPTRITINTPGWYDFGYGFRWAASITGNRLNYIQANGATILIADRRHPVQTAGAQTQGVISRNRKFNRGDYIETLNFAANGGVNIDLEAANEFAPIFWCNMTKPEYNPNEIPNRFR